MKRLAFKNHTGLCDLIMPALAVSVHKQPEKPQAEGKGRNNVKKGPTEAAGPTHRLSIKAADP